MIITTERITLRPFCTTDAAAVYNLASNPNVALATGYQPHDSLETTQAILDKILINDYTWAVTVGGTVAGCISLNHLTDQQLPRYEIGYWLGESYWGNGYMPEAVAVLSHYAIYTMGIDTVWCAYNNSNNKSHSVQDKCHFAFHHTVHNKHNPMLGSTEDMHYTTVTRATLDNYPAPQYTVD